MNLKINYDTNDIRILSSEARIQLASWSLACEYSISEQNKIFDAEPVVEKKRNSVLQMRSSDEACDLRIRVKNDDGLVRINCTLVSIAQVPITIEKIRFTSCKFKTGAHDATRCFVNGYQSWSETRSFDYTSKEMVSILPSMVTLQDNHRNLPPDRAGVFTSDMFTVIGDIVDNVYFLAGQGRLFKQFLYTRFNSGVREGDSGNLQLELDFGGLVVYPGKEIECDEIYLLVDNDPNRIQERYFRLISAENAAGLPLPGGWCSWYYYFTEVSEKDVYENLDAIRQHKINWKYFVIDDGYQKAVGDWLSINDKFPGGLQKAASHIKEFGMVPGIWLAPFIARRNSNLYHEHKDWFLSDEEGKPVKAGWNPNWGIGGNFYALDTTNPEFQDYLQEVIRTMVHEWGFKYLKLDFVYAASIYGLAFNREISSAERLSLGYQLIRKAAGKDVVILGCGSPLSPAIDHVDAMRIGPDVAPYWFATYRYHLTRDPHALCTYFAIRSILNRCQMHRRLWINDPDCILLRDTDTRLSFEERMSLVNAVIVTGGMYLLSDRLATLAGETWDTIDKIEELVRDADRGAARALDYMEKEVPELVYNSRGYLAVFNFSDKPIQKNIPMNPHLKRVIPTGSRLIDVWTGVEYKVTRDGFEVGTMEPHSSILFRVKK